MTEEISKFTCINCGYKVKELYKVYSPIVLKLSTCNNCHLVVDKYIEYDPIIIIIDLVLLNREAYRHVLFNTQQTYFWKLLVILELMESYSELSWMSRGGHEITNKPIMLDKFYTGDVDYYKTLLKVTFRNVIFLVIIIMLTLLYEIVISRSLRHFTKKHVKDVIIQIVKCMTISSFGIFLFLPSLIWEKHGTEEYHLIFVLIYTTLSQLVSYTVLYSCPKLWSIVVILCAYAIKMKSTQWTNIL